MTRKIIAIVTAATISMAAAAPMVQAQGMEMGFNMLTGAVYNELRARGLPTDGINDLTLSQLAIIKGIVDGDDGEGKKTNNIKAILNR